MKVREVQMKNLDRNESFLGHFIRKCGVQFSSKYTIFNNFASLQFSSFYSVFQPNFAIFTKFSMFFQVNGE